MRRRGYMFTDKSNPQRGIMSTILGILSDGAIGLAVFSSFMQQGAMNPRHGMTIIMALIFAIVGEVLGILSRMEEDKFYFFPILGILLNGIGILAIGFILYAGVFGI